MHFRVPAFSATVSGTSISRVSLDPSENVKLKLPMINISYCSKCDIRWASVSPFSEIVLTLKVSSSLRKYLRSLDHCSVTLRSTVVVGPYSSCFGRKFRDIAGSRKLALLASTGACVHVSIYSLVEINDTGALLGLSQNTWFHVIARRSYLEARRVQPSDV